MAVNGFVKIYGSKLITSSLWDEAPEARLVFLSLLAIADWQGFVDIPNERALARVMNVEISYLEKALAVLMAPDDGSRTPDQEGRRVLREGSGWRVVNYEKYREFRSATQEATRLRVEKHRAAKNVTSNAGNVHNPSVTADLDPEYRSRSKKEDQISESLATPQTEVAEPPVLVFPCSGKVASWSLTQSQVSEWSTLFPGIDVLDQCRRALAWVKANRPKTAKGMPRFLVGWIGRTNDRGGGTPNARPSASGAATSDIRVGHVRADSMVHDGTGGGDEF